MAETRAEEAIDEMIHSETINTPSRSHRNARLAAVTSCVLLVVDSLLTAAIIAYVPYTKIDWDAYISQVTGFMAGERDYSKLRGDTGPLVYPAGFLYFYSAIHYLTGCAVFPAQVIFGILYIINLGIILLIYTKTNLGMSTRRVLFALSAAAALQVLLGFPFLISYPFEYISRAFNLGRVFIHFWSVNFKFVPESVFLSKIFALALLVTHLILLFFFAQYKWCKHEGGILPAVGLRCADGQCKYTAFIHKVLFKVFYDDSRAQALEAEHITTVMFTGNFIGIVCARSLHYQFYSWYFYCLPLLLWKAPFPTPLRLFLFAGVEYCWNIYPSNVFSSFMLLLFHSIILWGLWIAPSEYPYVKSEKAAKKLD